MGIRGRAKLAARNAAAYHQHGIADACLSMKSACRSHGAERFFGAEGLLGKLQQRRAILRDQVRSHGAIAFGNRSDHRLLGHGHRCPEPAMHLFGRYLFLDCVNVPRISEGIKQSPVAVTVELIGDRCRQLGAGSYRMFNKSVHVGHIDCHTDGRLSQSLCAVAATFRPLLAEHDG